MSLETQKEWNTRKEKEKGKEKEKEKEKEDKGGPEKRRKDFNPQKPIRHLPLWIFHAQKIARHFFFFGKSCNLSQKKNSSSDLIFLHFFSKLSNRTLKKQELFILQKFAQIVYDAEEE